MHDDRCPIERFMIVISFLQLYLLAENPTESFYFNSLILHGRREKVTDVVFYESQDLFSY